MHKEKSLLVLFSVTLGAALSFSITSFGADMNSAAGAIISPDDPGPSDVRVTMESTVSHPISRLIYGVNSKYSDAAGWGPDLPPQVALTRLGGNRWTAWNWENGWSNAGSDWYYSNDQYLTTSTTPGAAVKPEADAAFAANTGLIVTLPIIGWSSKSISGINLPAPSAPNQTTPATPSSTYFQPMQAKNPAGAGSGVPHGNQGTLYADDFVKWLDTRYPGRATHATSPLLLSLDNEPDLWGSTHQEIRGRAPGNKEVFVALNLTGQDELVSKSIASAAAAKDVNPGIQTMGFVSYGWWGLCTLQNNPPPPYTRPGGGIYNWYVDVYLDKMKQASDAQSRRLLDIFDFHWYPEAEGSGYHRIIGTWDPNAGENAPQDAQTQDARMQAPRSLWDPQYSESSWITRDTGSGPIRLLGRIKDSINTWNPGTRIAVTEWWYGRGGDISGGIAVADVLGIFAREGVYAATMWNLSDPNAPSYGGSRTAAMKAVMAAFRAYLNYDGAGHGFGDTYLKTDVSDSAVTNRAIQNERVTAYASIDQSDPKGLIVIVINKSQTTAINTGFQVAHTVRFDKAEVYQITGGVGNCTGPTRQADIPITLKNAFTIALPPLSISTIVLKGSQERRVPPANLRIEP
jgi:hypothetical protein